MNLQRTWPTQPLALGSRYRVLGLPLGWSVCASLVTAMKRTRKFAARSVKIEPEGSSPPAKMAKQEAVKQEAWSPGVKKDQHCSCHIGFAWWRFIVLPFVLTYVVCPSVRRRVMPARP